MKSHTRQEGLLFHSLDLKISILVSLLIKLVQKKRRRKKETKESQRKREKIMKAIKLLFRKQLLEL